MVTTSPQEKCSAVFFLLNGLEEKSPLKTENSTKGSTWGLGKSLASMVEILGLPDFQQFQTSLGYGENVLQIKKTRQSF